MARAYGEVSVIKMTPISHRWLACFTSGNRHADFY